MKNLLLLHGALGSKKQLSEIADKLSNDFAVHSIDFSGHGENAADNIVFSIEQFASDIINWLDKNKIYKDRYFWIQHGGICSTVRCRKSPEKN